MSKTAGKKVMNGFGAIVRDLAFQQVHSRHKIHVKINDLIRKTCCLYFGKDEVKVEKRRWFCKYKREIWLGQLGTNIKEKYKNTKKREIWLWDS